SCRSSDRSRQVFWTSSCGGSFAGCILRARIVSPFGPGSRPGLRFGISPPAPALQLLSARRAAVPSAVRGRVRRPDPAFAAAEQHDEALASRYRVARLPPDTWRVLYAARGFLSWL